MIVTVIVTIDRISIVPGVIGGASATTASAAICRIIGLGGSGGGIRCSSIRWIRAICTPAP